MPKVQAELDLKELPEKGEEKKCCDRSIKPSS
jgi:hypothetical protein